MSKNCMRRVVDEDGLETYTAKGWGVVESYEVEAPIIYDAPTGSPYGVERRAQVGKVRRWVVELDEQSSLALADAHISNLNQQLRDAGSAARGVEALNRRIETLEHEAIVHKGEYKKSSDALHAAQVRIQRMERDLGKVRAEIGEERWRKIVGP